MDQQCFLQFEADIEEVSFRSEPSVPDSQRFLALIIFALEFLANVHNTVLRIQKMEMNDAMWWCGDCVKNAILGDTRFSGEEVETKPHLWIIN